MDALKWRGQRTVVSETMIVKELRSKRVAAEIPATLLAAKATVNRSRLSNLERGYALVFYVRNPRKNDAAVDRMCSSIREFSFKISVLARSAGLEVHLLFRSRTQIEAPYLSRV